MEHLRTKKKCLIKKLSERVGFEGIPSKTEELNERLNELFKKYKIVSVENGFNKCLCGTFARENYKLQNINNEMDCFYVGSSCVEYFSGLSKNYLDLFKEVEKRSINNRDRVLITRNINTLRRVMDVNNRYMMYGEYRKLFVDKYGEKYFIFRIKDVYIEFLNQLVESNAKVCENFWKFKDEWYVKIKKDNRRFNGGGIYKLGFSVNINGTLYLWKSYYEKPYCLIQTDSDQD